MQYGELDGKRNEIRERVSLLEERLKAEAEELDE